MGLFQSQTLHPKVWPENELKKFKEDFVEIAAGDINNTIDLDQFKTLLNNPDPTKLKYIILDNPDDYDKMFDTIDLNGDKQLSWDEIENFFVHFLSKPIDDKLSYIFGQYDTDGNGNIDSNEQKSLFAKFATMRHYTEGTYQADDTIGSYSDFLIEVMDANGDGVVSKDEWMKFGKDHPSMLILLGIANY